MATDASAAHAVLDELLDKIRQVKAVAAEQPPPPPSPTTRDELDPVAVAQALRRYERDQGIR